MKEQNSRKSKLSMLTLLILLGVFILFTLYIMTNTGAKHVIKDSFSINFSNYYIRVEEPAITSFTESPIQTSFTIHNNDATNYMVEDLVYTISVQENTKWEISELNSLTRTVTGGNMNSDTPLVTLTPKTGIEIGEVENITIVLTVTSPYPDTKTILLTYISLPTPTISLSTGSWTYTPSDLSVTSGTKEDSQIIVNPGATQYGPYRFFEKGTYNVTVVGTNLSNVNVDCTGSVGSIPYPVTNVVKTATQITYTVHIPEANSQVEFRTFANASMTSTVSQIAVAGASGNNDWHSSDVTVTINKNSEEGSIQPQYQLIVNGTAGQWTNYTEPFIISTEGTIVVNIKNIDVNMPEREKTGIGTTIKIDKTPPSSFTPAVVSSTKTTLTITGTTGDSGSQIANYYFSIDNGNTWLGPQSSETYKFTGLTAGTIYYIRQLATDNAGNQIMSNTLTAETLSLYRIEPFSFAANLADCGQYLQSSSGTDNSSGSVSATEVRATAGTSSFLQERNWTVWAGYKGTTLKDIVDNYINTNTLYSGWVSYDVTAKLTLQINIDFNTGNTSGAASCGTWIQGQSSSNNNLLSINGGSSNNGNHTAANLRDIYNWSNGQTPTDFFISIYVRKAGTWTDARTIRYYPSNGSSFVTLTGTVSIPNPD